MYNNPFNSYNPQMNIDRINGQIQELQKIREQLQQTPSQPTNLTQNFQLAPSNNNILKYAGSIEDVKNSIVIGDTPFFSKDMSVVWIKDTKGNIKIYELNEIIEKDDKDLKIEYLQAQIEELKKGMVNNEPVTNVNGSITDTSKGEKSSSISKTSGTYKKQK